MKGKFWIKRGISLAACLVMISATTVVAAENTRLIHSQGQYTLNSTEGPATIDTDDIEDNAEAIAALQGQLGGLSFRYGTEKDMGISDNEDKSYYWSKDTSGNWVKVGAVGTAVATDVLTGKKFSSEAGVDIPGSMPNPTSANVTYYDGGNNDSSGATSTTPKVVTISNDTDTTASHTDNMSQINLGINEQITIPHGYYNKDIVIKNGVANRGGFIGSGKTTYDVKSIRTDWESLTSDDFLVVLNSNFSVDRNWQNWGKGISKGHFGGMSLSVSKSYNNGTLTVNGVIAYSGNGHTDDDSYSRGFNASYNITSVLAVYCLK